MIHSVQVEGIGTIKKAVDLDRAPQQGIAQRFPFINSQTHGLVIQCGQIKYLRWVATRNKQFGNRWDEDSATLHYAVPSRTAVFVRETINSLLLKGNGGSGIPVMLLVGPKKYDIGTFKAQGYNNDLLTLQVTSCGEDIREYQTNTSPVPTLQPKPEISIGADSKLEERYRRLLRWLGFDAVWERIHLQYQRRDGTEVTYTPDGILHCILASECQRWCEQNNWHDTTCLLEIKPHMPNHDVFLKIRAVVSTHRWPLLLLCGGPSEMQCILFRPKDGQSTRVHLDYCEQTDNFCFRMGEPGEAADVSVVVESALCVAETADGSITSVSQLQCLMQKCDQSTHTKVVPRLIEHCTTEESRAVIWKQIQGGEQAPEVWWQDTAYIKRIVG